MGFLDRLVSDMVGDAVGISPRRVRRAVRLVGGKNLVMAGLGAALAGGVATAVNQQGGGRSAPSTGPPPAPGGSVPPPPPPTPGTPSAGPPPPPPPAAEPAADAEPPRELTYAIVRAMVAGALADGELDAREKSMIQDRLGESGLTPEQVAQVRKDLVLAPSPAELAAMTGDAEWRRAMYRFAALVILADEQVSDLERAWLDRTAEALGLDPERRAALETELFAD